LTPRKRGEDFRHRKVPCVPKHQEDVVKLHLPYRLAAAAGLWLSSLGYAQESAQRPASSQSRTAAISADQRLANAVAERLVQAPQLRGYQVEIAVLNGTVELTGAVSDGPQRDEILRIVRSIPNVAQVRDGMAMSNEIQPVNGPGQLGPPSPLGPGMPGAPMGGMPGLLPGVPGVIDPMPIGGPGAGATLAPPAMPPYAWPTYAPYNNYSRVAYPEQYPQAAFPFIGPFYPFPKVPLGYRAIKLEWEDGHWFYGRTAVKHDWWTVRYW
jgi:hypothetical protein